MRARFECQSCSDWELCGRIGVAVYFVLRCGEVEHGMHARKCAGGGSCRPHSLIVSACTFCALIDPYNVFVSTNSKRFLSAEGIQP